MIEWQIIKQLCKSPQLRIRERGISLSLIYLWYIPPPQPPTLWRTPRERPLVAPWAAAVSCRRETCVPYVSIYGRLDSAWYHFFWQSSLHIFAHLCALHHLCPSLARGHLCPSLSILIKIVGSNLDQGVPKLLLFEKLTTWLNLLLYV